MTGAPRHGGDWVALRRKASTSTAASWPGILPGKAAAIVDKVRPYSFLLFLAIVMTPVLDYLLVVPFTATFLIMQACLGALGLA